MVTGVGKGEASDLMTAVIAGAKVKQWKGGRR